MTTDQSLLELQHTPKPLIRSQPSISHKCATTQSILFALSALSFIDKASNNHDWQATGSYTIKESPQERGFNYDCHHRKKEGREGLSHQYGLSKKYGLSSYWAERC